MSPYRSATRSRSAPSTTCVSPLRCDLPLLSADSSRRTQGSIFFVVAAEERKRNAARLERRKQMSLPAALWDRVPHPWRGWNKENKAGSFEWTEDKFQQ